MVLNTSSLSPGSSWWEGLSTDEKDALFSPNVELVADAQDEIQMEIVRSSRRSESM